MSGIYIALGGNLGDVPSTFSAVCKSLEAFPDTKIIARSSLYVTKPWGVTDQPDFINACISLETALSPQGLLQGMFAIERAHGRLRDCEQKWGPRPLDLDLLAYLDHSINDDILTLPHPRLFERAFVLAPLHDIAAGDTINGKSISEAAAALDMSGVKRLETAW